jgi:hypothetical protein
MTTSLFARALSVSDQDAARTTWCGLSTRTLRLQRVGRQLPMPCKHTSWRHARMVGSGKSLDAALLSRAAINSPSHTTLQQANSARATRVPPMISTGVQLGLNVASSTHAQTGLVITKLLRGSARHPQMNSPAQPRDNLYDNKARFLFNAPRGTTTHERTSQRPTL